MGTSTHSNSMCQVKGISWRRRRELHPTSCTIQWHLSSEVIPCRGINQSMLVCHTYHDNHHHNHHHNNKNHHLYTTATYRKYSAVHTVNPLNITNSCDSSLDVNTLSRHMKHQQHTIVHIISDSLMQLHVSHQGAT